MIDIQVSKKYCILNRSFYWEGEGQAYGVEKFEKFQHLKNSLVKLQQGSTIVAELRCKSLRKKVEEQHSKKQNTKFVLNLIIRY